MVKRERAWYISSREWRHRQGKLCERWRHVNYRKLRPHARTGVKRQQHMKALLCRSSRDSREDREFYQAKTVKAPQQQFSHARPRSIKVLLSSFYPLTWGNVPGTLLYHTCKRWEAGQGPGNEAKLHQCDTLSTQPKNATCRFSWKCIEVLLS